MPCSKCGFYKELRDDSFHGLCTDEYSKAPKKRVVGRDGIIRLLAVVRWNDFCWNLREEK